MQRFIFSKEKYFFIRGTNRAEHCSNVLLYPKSSVSSLIKIKGLSKISGSENTKRGFRQLFKSIEFSEINNFFAELNYGKKAPKLRYLEIEESV